VFVRSLRRLGYVLRAIDGLVVDGAVRLVAVTAQAVGRLNTRMQSGQLQGYLLAAVFSVVILVLAVAGRRLW